MEGSEEKLNELDNIGNYGLVWAPRGTSRSDYDLRNGQQYLLGRFSKIGLKAVAGSAQMAAGRLKMTRHGFLGRKISIEPQECELHPCLFEFTGLFGKGRIKFANGREVVWVRRTTAGDRWGFTGTNGGLLVEFAQLNKDHWTDGTAVNVAQIALSLPEMPIMVSLGWYLILLMACNEHALMEDENEPYYAERYDK